MIEITSEEFVMFVLAQNPNRKYDMRDELAESATGSPLLHYCRYLGIRCSAVGAMDVYGNTKSGGKVIAHLERPTQAHFHHLNMEAGGTYGQLQSQIREVYLKNLWPLSNPPMKGSKLTSRQLIA